MNSIAVKAFLTGAMQEDPTDAQIEELIEFLQKHIKHSKVERLVLENLRSVGLEGIENSEDMRYYFFDTGRDNVELELNLYDYVDWDWIYEELQK